MFISFQFKFGHFSFDHPGIGSQATFGYFFTTNVAQQPFDYGGGLGTFAGPIVGAPMVTIISEITRDYGAWNMVFYSFIVIVIMRVYREGIVSFIRNLFKQMTTRKPQKQVAGAEN